MIERECPVCGARYHAHVVRLRHGRQTTCSRRCSSDVHHVRPYRLFDDYREANDLTNLLLLCRPCHRRADAAVQAA